MASEYTINVELSTLGHLPCSGLELGVEVYAAVSIGFGSEQQVEMEARILAPSLCADNRPSR